MADLLPQMPRAGVDYSNTFGQFHDWFSTDEACLEYLAKLRWPDGFVCPQCGGRDFWRTGAGCGCAGRASGGRR